MRISSLRLAPLLAVTVACCGFVRAGDVHHTGTVVKYSQPITHLIDPNWNTDEGMRLWGENIPSDVDWMHTMQSPTLPPNWVIADDFQDDFNLPVITVRWWGSYFPDGEIVQHDPAGGPDVLLTPGPGVEDGYLISFFRDSPGMRFDPAEPTPEFSRPAELLGSYVLPFDKIRVRPTEFFGWDEHPIYEYEADLWAGHLDHASDLARPDGFHQIAGEIYWMSIAAEVGHKVEIVDDGTGAPPEWVSMPTGKEAFSHYWGWHTSPLEVLDVATMSMLAMPPTAPGEPTIWEYLPWNPIQPQHDLYDMAFELLTVPEPVGLVIMLTAIGAAAVVRRRP